MQIRQGICPTREEREIIDYLAVDTNIPDHRPRGSDIIPGRHGKPQENQALIGY